MPFSLEFGSLIVAVPALGVLFFLYLASIHGGSAAAGSAARPQDPASRSRPGRLARWRASRGANHTFGRWTLGYASVLRSVSLGVDELRHHTLVCGATGSGKTSALQLLVDSLLEHLPMVVVDCKASSTLHGHFASIPNAYVWTIGGSLKWDPLRGDPTSVSNRLLQGEWYSREADVYRAIAERYLLWVLQTLDMAGVERTPAMVLQHLDPQVLSRLLRGLSHVPEAHRLAGLVGRLGPTEHEGIAGFRARFGLVLEGVAARSLGPGLALEDAIRARRPVLFSLDAASYPELATKLGAWILLDLVRVSALRPGPSLMIVDEFSALGREGRHVVPLLARTREAGMACVLATQGLADLAQVDANLPQQITQNTAVRLVLRQGSAEDQQAWTRLLGGAPLAITDSPYVRHDRAWAVSPDGLAMLRTGEAILQVAPRRGEGRRQRLWIARPRTSGQLFPKLPAPNSQMGLSFETSRAAAFRTAMDQTVAWASAYDAPEPEVDATVEEVAVGPAAEPRRATVVASSREVAREAPVGLRAPARGTSKSKTQTKARPIEGKRPQKSRPAATASRSKGEEV